MVAKPSFTLLDILRTTLTEVEQSTELPRTEPAFQELKVSLVRAMAELVILRSPEPSAELTQTVPILQPSETLD